MIHIIYPFIPRLCRMICQCMGGICYAGGARGDMRHEHKGEKLIEFIKL